MNPTSQPAGVSVGGQNITNPLLNPAIQNIGDVINILLPFIYGIAGIILFALFIWGGIDIVASAGDSEKVSAGRMKITAGIIGMVLLVTAYLMATFLGSIFGLGKGII